MSEEFQLLRESDRGQKAKDVLNNEVFTEAFSVIRESLHQKFELSKASDKDVREEAYRYLKVLVEIERHITTVMNTGKMADMMLSEREKKLKRIHPVHGAA